MTARIFDNRLEQEWIGLTILRRVIVAAAIIHFTLAAASGYRAIVQVYSVGIESPPAIAAGSRVRGLVTTSGRNRVDTRIELLRGQQVERIGEIQVLSNDSFFYDPRPKRMAFDALVPADILSRFEPGKLTLRIVAAGRSQWLRVPPPTVQTLTVELR